MSGIDLVDILRTISSYKYDAVLGRYWLVAELDVDYYGPGDWDTDVLSRLPLPAVLERGSGGRMVTGRELFETSALIHQVESGWFLRVVDPEAKVELDTRARLHQGTSGFQAGNVDMEIRRNEGFPFEVVSSDRLLIGHLQAMIPSTEVDWDSTAASIGE